MKVASTELGQGTRTVLAQIVADAAAVAYADVDVQQPDTAEVPDSGPTVASRTCMVVGGLLERCGRRVRRELGALTPQEYFARHGLLSVTEQFTPPPGLEWDEQHYRGAAYATYSYACDVVEVDVDRDTWEAKPLAVTSVHEIGKAIHPLLARGQIEGGTVQGLGMALLEEVVMVEGRMANAQLTNYLIPTSVDSPGIDVAILEHPYAHGPQGAKGLGELPIDGPAAAVVNAIRHAGYDVRVIPATPERIMEAPCASR